MWHLHVLPVHLCVISGYCCFLPLSKLVWQYVARPIWHKVFQRNIAKKHHTFNANQPSSLSGSWGKKAIVTIVGAFSSGQRSATWSAVLIGLHCVFWHLFSRWYFFTCLKMIWRLAVIAVPHKVIWKILNAERKGHNLVSKKLLKMLDFLERHQTK